MSEPNLEWGIQLPIQSLSRNFAAPWEQTCSPSDLLQVAATADSAGCGTVSVCDHVAIPAQNAETMGTQWYDPVATLGAISATTENVRLMTHVLIPAYRHPLNAAKQLATLDRLSGGRLVVGVGAGHVEGEFDALGIDFPERGRLLDEAIQALSAALTDEFPEFEGDTWRFSGVGVAPRPVQSPRPPIWVGGSSSAALRRAARLGDGWLPQGTRKRDLPAAVERLARWREADGREGDFTVSTFAEPVYVGTPAWDTGKYTVTGGADAIASALRDYAGLGVSHLHVTLRARSLEEYLEQLGAFGTEVGPLLRG